MKRPKLSGIVAAAGWLSVLIMIWLLFTGIAEWSTARVVLLLFVFAITGCSSMIYDGAKKDERP